MLEEIREVTREERGRERGVGEFVMRVSIFKGIYSFGEIIEYFFIYLNNVVGEGEI